MKEYQVTLSVPEEADSIEDAVREFRSDVIDGPDYVYSVDDGEKVWSFDAETGETTEAPRIDKGVLDALAVKVYGIAHEDDDPVQSDGDRQIVARIAVELYKLYGIV